MFFFLSLGKFREEEKGMAVHLVWGAIIHLVGAVTGRGVGKTKKKKKKK